ncbi:chemotaxis protein CheW [Amphibacillus indicireducens]|uniref:Chemotaxis protein CheW n=1 Tax=Amphibacillus indicireducens TaxID=1076330 RepID=A0ABP7VI73_9BACI
MSTEKYIVFQLNDQEYGTSIEQIVSIERLLKVVSLPKVSDFIEGITKLRGDVIPVIDLKKRMDLPHSEETDQSRMLVSNVDDLSVGFLVDAASDVIDIDDSMIEPAPTTIKGIDVNFLSGVAKLEDRLLLLVDLSYVLNYEEITEVKQVVEDEVNEDGQASDLEEDILAETEE